MFNSLSSWCYLLYLRRKIQNKKGRTEKIDGYVSPHQPSPVNHQPELHFCNRQMVPPADLSLKRQGEGERVMNYPQMRGWGENGAPTVLSEHANIWGAFVGTLWEWKGCNEDTALPVQAMQCLPPFTTPLKSNNDKTTTVFVSCGIHWVISQQRFAPLMYSCSDGGLNWCNVYIVGLCIVMASQGKVS